MAGAIQVIVQLKRARGGKRYVQEIVEVTGMEQNTITTQPIFAREKKKGAADAQEQLYAKGLVPSFMEKFTEAGVQLPPNFFDPATTVTYQAD
jgi:pilus assembly protein CpaF